MAWARAFEQLLEAKGVRRGRGGDRRSDEAKSSPTFVHEAKEFDVHPDTARNRLKLARDLEPYPETTEKVDRGDAAPVVAEDLRGLVSCSSEQEEVANVRTTNHDRDVSKVWARP